jgi:hypothetical protein
MSAPAMRRHGAKLLQVVTCMHGNALNRSADPASGHASPKGDSTVLCVVGFADCP